MAAASLATAAAVSASLLILHTHLHSLRSSAITSVYLFATLLFDLTRARSYYARDGMQMFGTLSVYTAAFKFALVLSEEITKRSLILDDHLKEVIGGEALDGFWTRSLFLWLNGTVVIAYRKVQSAGDLPCLGPELSSERISREFEYFYSKGLSMPWPFSLPSVLNILQQTKRRGST